MTGKCPVVVRKELKMSGVTESVPFQLCIAVCLLVVQTEKVVFLQSLVVFVFIVSLRYPIVRW